MPSETPIRINEEYLESDGDLVLYKGSTFSGIGYDLFPGGQGVEYETSYKDGLPHGVSRHWYSKGQLAYEVECKNGMTHGKEVRWHSDGSVKFEAVYEFGIKIRSKEWNDGGKLVNEFILESNTTNYQLLLKLRERG